jgi:hypothetical protein
VCKLEDEVEVLEKGSKRVQEWAGNPQQMGCVLLEGQKPAIT